MNQVQLLAGDPRTGYMVSSYMTPSQAMKTFTSITTYRIEVERGRGIIVLVSSKRID